MTSDASLEEERCQALLKVPRYLLPTNVDNPEDPNHGNRIENGLAFPQKEISVLLIVTTAC